MGYIAENHEGGYEEREKDQEEEQATSRENDGDSPLGIVEESVMLGELVSDAM